MYDPDLAEDVLTLIGAALAEAGFPDAVLFHTGWCGGGRPAVQCEDEVPREAFWRACAIVAMKYGWENACFDCWSSGLFANQCDHDVRMDEWPEVPRM